MPDGTTITEEHVQEERRTVETLLGGTVGGGIIAVAAVVLAIIGLAGTYPRWLLGAATIAVGIAFLIEGAAIASRLAELVHESTKGRVEMSELGSGVTGETLAGIVGIVLGVLGSLNVYPEVLLPVAAIVYGAGLILGAAANVRINELIVVHREEEATARFAIRQAVLATTGLQVFVGLASVTLGIIALASAYPITLSLVAMLLAAGSFALSDTAIAGRLPALAPRLPPFRKPWMCEDYRMSIFDAASFALTFFYFEK